MKKSVTFEALQELETKINRAYYRSRNQECFLESKRGYNYARKWEAMMIELRGWVDSRFSDDDGRDLTKPEWLKYCGKTLHPNYNLGDVMA